MEFTEELEEALTALDRAIELVADSTDMTNGADVKNALDYITQKALAVLHEANWA